MYERQPFYYATHTYLSFSLSKWKKQKFKGWKEYWREHRDKYYAANKWDYVSRPEDWCAVRILPETKHDDDYIELQQFEPLNIVLERLMNDVH